MADDANSAGDLGWVLAALAAELAQADDETAVGQVLLRTLTSTVCDFVEVVVPGDGGALWRVASGPGATAERLRAPIPDIADHPMRLAVSEGRVQRIDIDVISQRHLFGAADDAESAAALGVRSAVVVPLHGAERRLGAMALANGPSGRRFEPSDERFAVSAAGLAGMAMERITANRAQANAVDSLAEAGRIATAMAGASSVEEIGELLVSSARAKLGAATGLVYVAEPSQLVLVASEGYRAVRLDGWRSIGLDVSAPATDVLRSGQLLVLEHRRAVIDAYPYVEQVPDFEDEAIVAVPMRAGDRRVGAAFWAFDHAQQLDDVQRRFVVLVSDLAGASIDRVQLERARAMAAAALEVSATELAAERNRLSALSDAGVIGILSGEGDRITTANSAFRNMLGLAAESDPAELHWPALTPPEWAAVDARVATEMRRTGRAEPFEQEYWHVDGRRVPAMVGGVRLSAEPFRWIVFVADLTGRRDAEQRAEQARLQLEALLEEQRRIAHTLQTSLLPDALPTITDFEIAVSYWPADSGLGVGGDCYDVFPLGDGRWGFLVGDVCGKGAEAAAVTAAVRHSVRTAALHVGDPAAVLRWVHDAITALPTSTFCAVTYALLDTSVEPPTLYVAVAGHEPALRIDRHGESNDVGRLGGVLGLYTPRVTVDVATVSAGDLIALYTDGITDAPGPAAMSRRELDLLLQQHRHDPLDAIGGVVQSALAERRPNGSSDDVVLLLLRRVIAAA